MANERKMKDEKKVNNNDETIDVTDLDEDTNISRQNSSTVTALKRKRKLFQVKKWSAVALWAWDNAVDNCTICRNHLMDLCVECQANHVLVNSEQCAVAWGVCNHTFHLHCITRWLNTRQACPLDNREWQFQKHAY